MYLSKIRIRFYKSFSHDYLRKHHPTPNPLPWEMVDEMWYPHVCIPLEKTVTTIVGANESGKSHLLSAIEKGFSGKGITRGDFCRYSRFFGVREGEIKWPEFGFEFHGLTNPDKEAVRNVLGLAESRSFDHFLLFRSDRKKLAIWLPGEEYEQYALTAEQAQRISSLIPHVFSIDSKLGLPESVPLAWLASSEGRGPWLRGDRSRLLSFVTGNAGLFENQQTIQQNAPAIASGLALPRRPDRDVAEYELARQLLFDVAKIDAESISHLRTALQEENEGLVNGIIRAMNVALANAMNFPRWWVQDKDFELRLTARDDDLVFTIRDRTQTEYSFKERSFGLRYFLSYYIQYLAHRRSADRAELLLMDEPDAYLSNQGQQDLLKIFNAFAAPRDGHPGVQVVYVTHSPFLLDKNHAERVRVLEKGTGDEGTRVVRNAAHNHYEPLRSALGAYVGESAFIGNCNLFVEGISDQILIAGASAALRSRETPEGQTLDLNTVTIVPSGSASHVPYLVYLARGRDADKPAVLVLLDSDKEGNDAVRTLRRFGPKHHRLLPDEGIVQIGELKDEMGSEGPDPLNHLVEIEDLVPPALLAEAARSYLTRVFGADEASLAVVNENAIRKNQETGGGAWQALKKVVDAIEGDVAVEKIGVAREVIDCLNDAERLQHLSIGAGADVFLSRMGVLSRRLRAMQRTAERALSEERISHRVKRTTEAFRRDHPSGARREDAQLLIEDIERNLGDSEEADTVRTALQQLRRGFNLTEEPGKSIERYPEFVAGLARVSYAAVQPDSNSEAGGGDELLGPTADPSPTG